MSAPVFLSTSTAATLAAVIAGMESAIGKTLYAAQLERLLCDVIAYREVLLRLAIQASVEQNLVDYATGARLEALGDLVGVSARKAAEPADVTWRITLPTEAASGGFKRVLWPGRKLPSTYTGTPLSYPE